jgi:hypothetical protein
MNEIYKYFYCIPFYLWSGYILMVNLMVQIYIIKIHVLFFFPAGPTLMLIDAEGLNHISIVGHLVYVF